MTNEILRLRLRMTWASAFLLCCTLASIEARVLEMKTVRSKGQFADMAGALEDSVVCDTSLYLDTQGQSHRVFCDSGRVYYQVSPWPSPFKGEEEKEHGREGKEEERWSVPIRLSFRGVNSSPVIFPMDEPGERPRIVAMWREEHEDWVEVWFRYQDPGALPMQWSVPLSLAQPRY